MDTNNYQAEELEFAENQEVLSDETDAAIEDDWYSDGFAERPENSEEEAEAGGEAAEADQPGETDTADNKAGDSPETNPDPEANGQQQEQSADQRFTLKHLDETREVNREEVIALAQKGLDYDRKTEKLNSKIAGYEEFIDELAGPNGLSREQFMDSVRAKLLVVNETQAGRTMSEADALLKIQADRAEKAKASAEAAEAQQQAEKTAREQQTREALARFANARPEVNAADIPKSVWDEFAVTGDLESAYAKHENAELRRKFAALEEEVATLKQNAENARHSSGSRKSTGTSSSDSAFDQLWYDGT